MIQNVVIIKLFLGTIYQPDLGCLVYVNSAFQDVLSNVQKSSKNTLGVTHASALCPEIVLLGHSLTGMGCGRGRWWLPGLA